MITNHKQLKKATRQQLMEFLKENAQHYLSTEDSIDLFLLERLVTRMLDRKLEDQRGQHPPLPRWQPTPENPHFDAGALRHEIARVFGEHGAHMEVFKELVHEHQVQTYKPI